MKERYPVKHFWALLRHMLAHPAPPDTPPPVTDLRLVRKPPEQP